MKLKRKNNYKICRFGHRIKIGYESFLVFNGKNYCVKCVIKMIEKHNSLPNDGSVKGAGLAQKLCEHRVKI
jgi:5-methylcytosine-specific restriction endonuclease McrBC regulatory subunit McrC